MGVDNKKYINYFILFLFFFITSWGFGYAILNRYNPTELVSLSDVGIYANIVKFGLGEITYDMSYRSTRVIFPLIARGFYLFLPQLGSWDTLTNSLLITSSIFSALSALLIMDLSFRMYKDQKISILASYIFLTSFIVVNLHQVGLIDSAYCFCFILLIYILHIKKYYLIVPLFIFGTLTKEQFIVFGSSITFFYIFYEYFYNKTFNKPLTIYLFITSLLSTIVMIFVHSYVKEGLSLPWQIIVDTQRLTLTDSSGWKVRFDFEYFISRSIKFFIAMGPLILISLPNLKKIKNKILFALLLTGILQIILGTVVGITGTGHARSFFNLTSFIFCVSAAFSIKSLLPSK